MYLKQTHTSTHDTTTHETHTEITKITEIKYNNL